MARHNYDLVDITPVSGRLISTPVCISVELYDVISGMGPNRSWWLVAIARKLKEYLDIEADDILYFPVMINNKVLSLMAAYIMTPEGLTICVELMPGGKRGHC